MCYGLQKLRAEYLSRCHKNLQRYLFHRFFSSKSYWGIKREDQTKDVFSSSRNFFFCLLNLICQWENGGQRPSWTVKRTTVGRINRFPQSLIARGRNPFCPYCTAFIISPVKLIDWRMDVWRIATLMTSGWICLFRMENVTFIIFSQSVRGFFFEWLERNKKKREAKDY